MRRLSALLVLALAVPVVAQEPSSTKSPEEEYVERMDRIRAALADEHAGVGAYLVSQQMYDWSRVEFRNAIKHVPNHEKANKGLGFTVWNEDEKKWEIDPSAKPMEVRNLKKGEDADTVRLEYQRRLKELGKKIGKMYFDLGVWCQKAFPEDKQKANSALKTAVDYDPTNKDARTKLGHQKQKDGGWLSKEEIALRKEMKEGIAKAIKGQATTETTETESKVGLKMATKYASEHFLFESTHLDEKTVETLMQHAEHAYAMYHKIMNQNSLYGSRQNLIVLKDKGQHEKYVDVFGANLPPEYKKECKESTGLGGGMQSETWQGDRPQSALEDWTIHHTIMACSRHMAAGERHWLHEGLAYYFTRLMHDSAGTHCTDMRGTGPGGEQKNFTDAATWPIVIREWLTGGQGEPDINKIFKCRKLSEFKGGDPVKAWSLCEFLVTEHRERLVDYMQRLKSSPRLEDDEKMFSEVFGWTLQELDDRWRIYAAATYLGTKGGK